MDTRQQSKVLHKLSEIIGISFFVMIANANDPEDIELFSKAHEGFMREYFKLENGIPSHDTIQRAFEMVSPEYLKGFQQHFNELLNTNEGEKIRKILAIDDLNIKGHIITTDTMGTQRNIVKKSAKRKRTMFLP